MLEKRRKVVFDSRTIGIPLDDPEGYLIDGEYGPGFLARMVQALTFELDHGVVDVERGDVVGVQVVDDEIGAHPAAAADLEHVLPDGSPPARR